MKQYEKPTVTWVALESTNVILASVQLNNGGAEKDLTKLPEFDWEP